jgi:DNA polymerase elongation subunit (family B)
MYQQCYYESKKATIHLWDDKKGYMKLPFQRYGYIKDPNGEFVTLFGQRCSKTTHLDGHKSHNLFESDVTAATRVLVDMYLNDDNPSEGVRICTFDIEVEKDEQTGYSTVQDADNRVNSIALYDHQLDQYHVIILDEELKLKPRKTGNREIHVAASERILLEKFYSIYNQIQPHIITGWNIDFFDVPYLYNRACKVIGKKKANCLSPLGIVEPMFRNDEDDPRYKIAGVSALDYIELYKKFTYSEEESYTLDAISMKELKRGKIEYDGDLKVLYNTDIEKFIEYNLVDVELVVELDRKLGFIDLARTICHKGHVPYDAVYHSSKYLEGASLTYLKRLGIVAPNKKQPIKLSIGQNHRKGETKLYVAGKIPNIVPGSGQLRINKTKSSKFVLKYSSFKEDYFVLTEPLPEPVLVEYGIKTALEGAFVKQPKPGRYDWIYDLDLTSLYPSIIMTLNISPETKVGKCLNFDGNDFVKDVEKEYKVKIGSQVTKYDAKAFRNYLTDNNYSVAANGVMYDKNKKGFIPSILETWFDERVEFKNMMKDFKRKGDTSNAKFYNNRQQTQKILLNSFYGVLALATFRFYDVDNAEATTLSGQSIIKFSADIGNQYYNQTCKTTDTDYCIYTDTDSTFFSSWPIVQARYPDVKITDDERMTQETLNVAGEVQGFINNAYNIYAKKFMNVEEHRLEIKQELVAKAGFWVAKKRYAQLILNEEGVQLPEPHLDVKGLDVVRSNFPRAFRTFMSDFLFNLLNGMSKDDANGYVADFKENLKSRELLEIMSPSSVKDIKKYEKVQTHIFNFPKGTPVHVKAAMAYNDILKKGNKVQFEPITNGSKVKYIYLKQNPLGIESCAIRGFDDPEEIVNFIKQYIDYEKIFENLLGNKLQDFYDGMEWGTPISNSAVNEFFQF